MYKRSSKLFYFIKACTYNHAELYFYINGCQVEFPLTGIRGTVYPAVYGMFFMSNVCIYFVVFLYFSCAKLDSQTQFSLGKFAESSLTFIICLCYQICLVAYKARFRCIIKQSKCDFLTQLL